MKYILLEIEEQIAIVTINRAEALNALNQEVISELIEVFSQQINPREVRVVLLTGAGKAFVAGADIKEMVALTPAQAHAMSQRGQYLLHLIENFSCPVIALVNGYALGGGCELAMACDFRLASVNAKLGQPEVNLGVTPGFGGTQRLTRLVGIGRAKQMLYSAEVISAQKALEIDLVNEVYPIEKLMPQARKLAATIAAKAPLAVAYCKQAVNSGHELPLERANAIEADLFALSFATKDQTEGMQAFIDKRPAIFQGQ